MIVNSELERLRSDPDVDRLRRAHDANTPGCLTIGRRGRSVRREAALLRTEGEDGRATIITTNSNTEAHYFEAARQSTIWIPWDALPDGARQQRFFLVSKNTGKTAYYERSDEARVRLPDGILGLVSGGGLFRWAKNSPQIDEAATLVVRTSGRSGRKDAGERQSLQVLLNPWVFELDTMTGIGEKEKRGLVKIATEGEVDFHPELAPADWLRTRVHASLVREWMEQPARGSVMLALLLGPKVGIGRKPWEMARAFPALDAHHGQFDVRLRMDGMMDVEWGDGETANGDPLIAHAGAVLGANLRPSKTGMTVPAEGLRGTPEPTQDEERELKSVMETYLDATTGSLAGLVARVGAITATECKILENDLKDGKDHPQAAIEQWCMNHVQPQSTIRTSFPEPPVWIGDRGWGPDATMDPRGGDRRDLPRSRAAMWWLRLLEPGNGFDDVERLEAYGPRWKSQFFVWLFRGRDVKVPQWGEPQERTPAQGDSWGRLAINLVLGGRRRQEALSGPEQLDWPRVLEQ